MTDVLPRIVGLATARPPQDVHPAFIDWAEQRIEQPRERALFRRMAGRAGIAHRFAVLPPTADGGSPVDPGGFYAGDDPSTAARMALYAEHAPALALAAIGRLSFDPQSITHLVVASCTGFVAPGVDQIIARRLGLVPSVERLLVGFMGCYAAVTALRSAAHIVRSTPQARVLVVTVELSSLHLNRTGNLESLLAMLQFGDGAAAALVQADGAGLSVESPFATTLPESATLIRWDIGDNGFLMHLSGEVPGRIAEALRDPALVATLAGGAPAAVDAWAVHAGGRSILDAVEHGLSLTPDALAESRAVLHEGGNMSSSTLMFVLERMMGRPVTRGVALAFGPGLAAEGFRFRSVA
ncbi:type III polyketide synthase [Chakrabartia godavariana]|nr:type III polyketide synthase [Chakrabartia godavariana]